MLLNIFIQCIFIHFTNCYSDKPILIVVSYDGFRYDYISKALTPGMLKLRKEGAYADYVYNVFPTKTFVNHFTIATGMYAEEHGVMGNNFYDPILQRNIQMEKSMFLQNPSTIPIWTLNQMAGNDRYSGCIMWPGCKYAFYNITPTYFENWNRTYDIYKRIDTAISWIMDPQYPANLVMIYIEEPDFHGHIYSPDSAIVHEMIRYMDNVTVYLHDQLRRKKLSRVVNVVHLGDHGMVSMKYENIINVTEYLDQGTYKFADYSPTLHVIPNDGYEKDVYSRLRRAATELGHFSVYRKGDIPNRWHYKRNVRAPPILLLADKGYAFQDFADTVKKYETKYDLKVDPNTLFGIHGYDLSMKEMYSFFMARGPLIKKNVKVHPFNSVDLYALFANILGIPSFRPENMKLNEAILETSDDTHIFRVVVITVGGVLLSLLLISCAAAITVTLIKRQQNMTTTVALNKRFPKSFQQAVEEQHLLDAEEA